MANPDFALPMGVVLDAVCRRTAAPKVRFHVLDYGLDSRQRERLMRIAARWPRAVVQWHRRPVPMARQPGEVLRHVCRDRLVFLDEAAAECARALFLDADVLVNGDLAELWACDLGSHVMGAVRDFGYPTFHDVVPRAVERLRVDGTRPYFNIGVLLVNLDEWRSGRVTRRCLDAWEELPSEDLRHPDQDLMNLLLPEGIQELDPAWNAQVIALQHHDLWPEGDLKERIGERMPGLLRAPHIWHWPGPYKPWLRHPGCDVPLQRRYRLAVLRSGWFSPLAGLRWLVEGKASLP